MPVLLAGVILGTLSSTGTYLYTGDTPLAAAVGAIVAVLAWLGIGTVIICDD
jgi:uncharacterized membrane protein